MPTGGLPIECGRIPRQLRPRDVCRLLRKRHLRPERGGAGPGEASPGCRTKLSSTGNFSLSSRFLLPSLPCREQEHVRQQHHAEQKMVQSLPCSTSATHTRACPAPRCGINEAITQTRRICAVHKAGAAPVPQAAPAGCATPWHCNSIAASMIDSIVCWYHAVCHARLSLLSRLGAHELLM